MSRHIKIHDDLVVPEDGTDFQVPDEQPGNDKGLGVEIYVPGIPKPFTVVGENAKAVMAFALGVQNFPVYDRNGRMLIDIPQGWRDSQGARQMYQQNGQGALSGNLSMPPPQPVLQQAAPYRPTEDWMKHVPALAYQPPTDTPIQTTMMPQQPRSQPGIPVIDESAVERALSGELYREKG